jgi:hypothetical protein
MNKTLFLLLIPMLLLASCRQTTEGNVSLETSPIPSMDTSKANDEVSATDDQEPSPAVSTEEQPLETLGPDCYGDQIHPIGQSIADLYPEQMDYEEVMTWFCNGFEFEDILTALQTAEETDYSAEELLSKFEHGQTWEEIWIELGIVEP